MLKFRVFIIPYFRRKINPLGLSFLSSVGSADSHLLPPDGTRIREA